MKTLRIILTVLLILSLTTAALGELGAPIPWDAEKMPYLPKAAGYLPDHAGYKDESLDIRVETFRHEDTTVMAVYVTIKDPSQLRTVTASPTYPSKALAPVAALTKRVGAVLGINGDYFSFHGQGVVVRNTRVLRSRPHEGRDTLIIDEKGDFTILTPTTQEKLDAFQGEIIHAFCFGPGLVVDGKAITSTEGITINNGKNKKTQRMVIGQLAPLQYLILTNEGPENQGSVGFDLLQMAKLCQDMGMKNAYNLDGGSSCTVALNNKKINARSSGKVRSVGDIICFASLEP